MSTQQITIILYHSVRAQADPLSGSVLDIETFRLQMGSLKRYFNVITLGQALRGWQRGSLPRRTLCVTFDDGYADNIEVAVPVLEGLGIKATFFIATGFFDGRCMWNDEIIEAIRGCTEPMLDLRDIGLEMYQLGTLERRRAAIQSVIQHFKRTPPARRSEAVAAVVAKAGGDVRRDLMMTPAQVKSLSERGMEVGAHTVSHPILTQLCLDEARREITNSKRCLESITAEPVRLFAYPNGSPGEDYTAEHVSLVRSLGFDAAVSTAPGSARLNGDLFQLARVRPGRRRGLRFIGKLVKDAFTLPPSYA